MSRTIFKIFAGFALFVLFVSCERENLSREYSEEELRTIEIGFEATKTIISDAGLTLWAEGDSLWVTNGTETEVWHVPAEAAGTDVFSAQTMLQGDLKIVYPYSAAKGVSADGLFQLTVPSTMEGSDFAKANIAVAVVKASEGEETRNVRVKMKNVTGVMKFRISTDAMYPPKAVGLSAPGQVIAGDCTVDLSSGTPVVKAGSGTSMILVTGTEGGGTFYASVIPCELKEGFSYIGVGIDLDCESISSTKANTIAANDMVDLGEFGTRELKPLEGEGTEASPYLIHNLPEWLAVTYFVNESPENTMSGKYLKLMDNISGISIPVGTCIEGVDYYFRGILDGNGKTMTLGMAGGDYQGLFGELGPGACVHDVTIDGSVSGATCTGGVAGCVNATSDSLYFTNCVNKAKITGTNQTGGIFGFANASTVDKVTGRVIFENCSNQGPVTGTYCVGGLCGYLYMSTMKNCNNTGFVTGTASGGQIFTLVGNAYAFSYPDGSGKTSQTIGSFATRGTGGLVGYSQNVSFETCANGGAVNGVSKVGGIAGTMYWSSSNACVNNGPVTGSNDFVGGITGWVYVQTNMVGDVNNAPVSGNMMVGGIAGFLNASNTSNTAGTVRNATNKGKVTATGTDKITFYNATVTVSAAGGIIGSVEELYSTYSSGGKTYARYNRFNIYNNLNEGDVEAVGNAVGGITGFLYHPLNNMNNGFTKNCENRGSVTGSACVGGVIGQSLYRFTSSFHKIYNCENHGDVLATADAATVYVGGVTGWCSALYPAKAKQSPLYNCYNTGKVQYSNAAATAPDAGGIFGYAKQLDCKNVYNSGVVGPLSGEAAETAADYMGALAGYVGDYSTFNNGYYLDPEKKLQIYGKKLGSAGMSIGTLFSSCDEEGKLATTLTIGETDCENVVDALNAWVGTSTDYYKWTAGPKFVKE